MAYTCNPSSGEAEAGGLPEFKVSLYYVVRPCLKKIKFLCSSGQDSNTYLNLLPTNFTTVLGLPCYITADGAKIPSKNIGLGSLSITETKGKKSFVLY